MADLALELAQLNAQARELLARYDGAFEALDEKTQNKIIEIQNKAEELKAQIEDLGVNIDFKLNENGILVKNDGSEISVGNALKLGGKSLEEIQSGINELSGIKLDTDWNEFTWKNTGGGNKGAIFKVTADFDIKYAIALLKHKDSGHIFLISSASPNMVTRDDGVDYGATVVIKGRTVGVGVGEDGLPLGESASIFDNTEGLDTFSEDSNNTLDADDFLVRVLIY